MHFKMLHQDKKKKHHHTINYVSNCYHGFQKYTLINVAVNITLVSKMSLIVNLSKISSWFSKYHTLVKFTVGYQKLLKVSMSVSFSMVSKWPLILEIS